MHDDQGDGGLSRREFVRATGLGALALGAGALAGRRARAADDPAARAAGERGEGRRYNILFILSDQERHFQPTELPSGYSLPGRERLRRRGVSFTNHQINSAVCTSSRSNLYTGRHIQHTRLFDNMNFPWMDDLSHQIPTLGNLLGEAGYYAAYKGKWHMSKEMETHDALALPQETLTRHIEGYGFKDFVGIGDVIGMTQGGHVNDDIIGAQARRWLRLRGQRMNAKGEPWFLAVNLVNPHDVMFFNTDAPGQEVQSVPRPLMQIAREPDTPLYRQQWRFPLPASRHEPFDRPGRPAAHRQYQDGRGALVGNFPDEDPRWRRLLNYYFNCIQQNDRVVEGILDELDDLSLVDDTIVVMTADHGELAGSHGMHGKGTCAYREQNHVPLIVAHPAHTGTHGQHCEAVTSHIDIAPSMLGWAAAGSARRRPSAAGKLPGRDLTPLLERGASASRGELRTGSLYCFNMFAYLDAAFIRKIQSYLNAGGDKQKLAEQGFKPDLRKRGAIRSVFDGRYSYTRYFSPRQHNQPRTLEGIFELNDVELFDRDSDPDEMQNLAPDRGKHGDLLLAMNGKMNALLEAELGGPDDGSFLPGEDVNWAATTFDP